MIPKKLKPRYCCCHDDDICIGMNVISGLMLILATVATIVYYVEACATVYDHVDAIPAGFAVINSTCFIEGGSGYYKHHIFPLVWTSCEVWSNPMVIVFMCFVFMMIGIIGIGWLAICYLVNRRISKQIHRWDDYEKAHLII